MLFNNKIGSPKPDPEADERVSVTLKSLVNLAQPASVLNLHHSCIRSQQSGGYVSRVKGRGMEFDEARLYQPGDDIRSIDWRVTARTGKPHTKLFREERERPVFISVDSRATMRFATRGVFKFVQAARLASLIAWAAQRHGDRIGGQIFTDSACIEIKPQHGRYAVLRFLHGLAHPENGANTEFTFEHGLARLIQHVRPGSLVYIISDFRGLNMHAEQHLKRLSEHCDVVLIMVYDSLESELPINGRYRFTDNERDVVIDTHDRLRVQNYQQRFASHCRRLENLAKKYHMTYLRCSTADDPVQSLL
ncbi:MAG: DUF58 domain-containing protein [Gammaproteobacteria bacterium]